MLYEKITQHAEKLSKKIAIKTPVKEINYEDLKKLVDIVAILLNKVNKEYIGIIDDQSVESVVFIIAGALSNKIIIPIDPRLTLVERQKLTNGLEIDFLDNIKMQSLLEGVEKERTRDFAVNEQYAYGIFTSGSTGRPKLVLASVQALEKLIEGLCDRYYIDRNTQVIQFSYLSFDSAIVEIWSTILSGATLILPGKRIREDLYGTLIRIFQEERDLVITLPPTVAQGFIDKDFPKLKSLIVAGEECSLAVANGLLGKAEHIINAYGPTESIICATTFEIKRRQRTIVPIGTPLPGMKIVLTENGEAILYGDYLSEGYVGLRSGNFGFNNETKQKYFKTGDILKIQNGKNYVFVGRKDNQLKIHGQKVQIEVVERKANKILEQKGYREHIYITPIVAKSGEWAICGVIGAGDHKKIQKIINTNMPQSIKLHQVVTMKEIPYLSSGKINYKKIKQYVEKVLAKKHINALNKNATIEEEILRVYQQILAKKINIDDNFFEIGGDSLAALRILDAVNNKYNINLVISDILLGEASPRQLVSIIKRIMDD